MTTPTKTPLNVTRALKAVPDTVTPRDDDDPPDRGKLAFRIGVLLLLGALIAAFVVFMQGRSAEDQAAELLRLIDTECGPDGTAPGSALCIATAPQRAQDTQQAAAATGVDAAQVIALVRAELAANPPRDGRTPTPDEIAGVVRSVLAANPELYRGEQGIPGTNGTIGAEAPPPTDEQVQAAVAAVMAADPALYRGEPGEKGAQGVGVQSVSFARRGGQCLAVVVLADPATGTTSEKTSPVADEVCPGGGTTTPLPDDTPDTGTPPTENPPPTDPSTDPPAAGDDTGGLFGG